MGDMEHIYGPVPSRRLGFSLGVDLVPHKICSFDCVYCQLGKTTEKTIVRREYVPAGDVVADVKEFLERGKRCDYITLSGSGEPTLNSKTGEIIEAVKSLTGIPVAVLTNGSTMTDSDVRRELSLADVVIPSLDAAVQSLFEKVNRPCRGMRVEDIIAGISEFKKSFSGKVWLEVMLVDGVNDSEEAFRELSRAIGKIKPDKVHLNTVVRPPCERWAKPLSTERLEEIANSLNAE
ncbi:MAG TPA: radical SAM protein, partial [Candidatus Altiarchaeales archaeon]|nr:radical SAM protein [Candidatus Altiarchaeales archaeon]